MDPTDYAPGPGWSEITLVTSSLPGALMAYRNNWHRHFFAIFTGDGLSEKLAKDFWTSREDLWDSGSQVNYRWLKLVIVYVSSFVTQVLVPGSVLLGGLLAVQDKLLKHFFVSVGIVVVIGLPSTIVVATITYFKVRHEKKSQKLKE